MSEHADGDNLESLGCRRLKELQEVCLLQCFLLFTGDGHEPQQAYPAAAAAAACVESAEKLHMRPCSSAPRRSLAARSDPVQ
jgi:hypothetical protein